MEVICLNLMQQKKWTELQVMTISVLLSKVSLSGECLFSVAGRHPHLTEVEF